MEEQLVEHFTIPELVAVAHFNATPEAQSLMRKMVALSRNRSRIEEGRHAEPATRLRALSNRHRLAAGDGEAAGSFVADATPHRVFCRSRGPPATPAARVTPCLPLLPRSDPDAGTNLRCERRPVLSQGARRHEA